MAFAEVDVGHRGNGEGRMSAEALLLFQLGPVQSFIAQAKRLGDLAAGSEMLSEVTFAALQAIPDFRSRAIFPSLSADSEGEGIPNRFLVRVLREEAVALAQKCEMAAQAKLREIGAPTRATLPPELQSAFDQQVAAFLQITWSILEEPSGEMGKDYQRIGRLMALRRNTRTFSAWHEEAMGQGKDVLSGKEAALQGGLGAMNLIKQTRTLDAEKLERIPAVLERGYLAVLAMDGDQMGVRLSNFHKVEEHRAFSERLVIFADEARRIVRAHDGFCVYAGGDDVLAVLPPRQALACARALRACFGEEVGGTASTGIAIDHVQTKVEETDRTPLQTLVQAAHAAEHRAKEEYGRDALAVTAHKPSGETIPWGCKWGSPAFEILRVLREHRESEAVTASPKRFATKLSGFLRPYALEKMAGETSDKEMLDVILQDSVHTLKQCEQPPELEAETLKAYLWQCNSQHHLEDYLNLFLLDAFVAPREVE